MPNERKSQKGLEKRSLGLWMIVKAMKAMPTQIWLLKIPVNDIDLHLYAFDTLARPQLDTNKEPIRVNSGQSFV